MLFKLNFIALFVNCICKSQKSGFCIKKIVKQLCGSVDINKLDWCSYVLNAVRNSKRNWIPYSTKSAYAGPTFFLVVTYLHHIRGPGDVVSRQLPAIANWSYDKVKERETNEMTHGGFGSFESRDETVLEIKAHVSHESREERIYEETVLDIKSKIGRIGRYKQELLQKFSTILDDDPHNAEILGLKNDFDSLFCILDQATWDDNNGDASKTITKDPIGDASVGLVNLVINDCMTSPKLSQVMYVTPVKANAKPTTPSAKSKDKHPLDTPISPYVLQVVDEAERNSSNMKTLDEKNKKIKIDLMYKIEPPNFDLGISQEFGGLIASQGREVHNSAGEPIEIPLVNPDHEEGENSDEIPLSKRLRKPSQYKCSPYYKRQVNLLDFVNATEIKVSERLFALRGETSFPIFSTVDGCFTTRTVMESLIPNNWVALDVINAWCMVLNHEETLRAKVSPNRVFFNVGIMNEEMFTPDYSIMKGYKAFTAGIARFLKRWNRKDNLKRLIWYSSLFITSIIIM